MITIKESAWFVDINLAADPQLKMLGLDLLGGAGLILPARSVLETFFLTEAYQKLSALGNYELKVFERTPYSSRDDQDDEDFIPGLEDAPAEKPASADPVSLQVVKIAPTIIDENGHVILRLPKAKLEAAKKVLTKLRLPFQFTPRVYPKAKAHVALKAFPNPARLHNPQAPETLRLEPLQAEALIDGLLQRRPGPFVVAMGGGKSILIGAILAAYPDLRPAVVTSAASADSQQLAAKIKLLLGENVKLVGCSSGALTTAEKKKLFSRTKDASIIVGSHRLFERIAPDNPSKPRKVVKGAAALLKEKIGQAKLIILDEAHECASEARLTSLLETNPDMAYALTATWLKNWSKTDRILGDVFNLEGTELCNVSHSQVEETGRVTPTEVFAYTLDRRDFGVPERAQNAYRGFGIMQEEVEFHPGRNLFVAALCNHLMEVNYREGRGCILAFANTIGHATRVARALCEIRGIPFKEGEMEFDSIYLFNSKISPSEKTRRMTAMREGRTKVVISTETLSRGIDMNTIYDVVDLTGSSKIVQLIQKTGRSVRPDGEDKVARMHLVAEQDIPDKQGKDKILLRKISEAKVRALEKYFARPAITIRPGEIPWAPKKPIEPPAARLDLSRLAYKNATSSHQTGPLPASVSGS